MVDHNLSKLESRHKSTRNVLLIPGAGNSADVYLSIAQSLTSSGSNVFVIHHDGVDTDKEPLSNISAMAEKYKLQILRHCIGDFLIVGYCIGGTIGYEIVRGLKGTAIRPSGLFLIDATLPTPDFLALSINSAAFAFDENAHMREFFRAICTIYSKESTPIEESHFIGLPEKSCLARSIASMKLESPSEENSWIEVIQRRYRVEKAHTMAIYAYGFSQANLLTKCGFTVDVELASCSVTILESEEVGRRSPANPVALKKLGFRDITIKTVAGRHESVLADHQEEIIRSLKDFSEYAFSLLNTA